MSDGYAPRGPGDPAQRHAMYGPPPMQQGSMPPNKPLPPSFPPHLQGPNERPPGPPTSAPQVMNMSGAPTGPPGAPRHHPSFPPPVKELTFPPNTVEGTLPRLVKKRRLTAKDVSQIEAWRLLMCLKSGMLAESTWALDVLSILVHDDNTVLYFGLQNLPGLLDVLLEHYVKYLSEIFDGLFDDNSALDDVSDGEKNCLTKYRVRRKPRPRRKWYELESDLKENDPVATNCDNTKPPATTTPDLVDLAACKPHIPSTTGNKADEPLVLLNSTANFTLRSRDGKPVKIDKSVSTTTADEEKRWELFNEDQTSDSGFNEDEDDETSHILTEFESREKFVRFARVLKEKSSNTTSTDVDESDKADHSEKKKEESPTTTATEATITVKQEQPDEPMQVDAPKEEPPVKYPIFRSPKRVHAAMDDLEEEATHNDDSPLCPVDAHSDSLVRRTQCLSTLIRNLSFVPGNDIDMSKHKGLLMVLSRLLLLNHEHVAKKRISTTKVADADSLINECESLDAAKTSATDDNNNASDECDLFECAEREWHWDAIHLVLENSLVTLANIAGQLDISPFSEHISLPLLDGLLHWAVCPSSYARDHLPTTSLSSLSPQRLAMEALVKLSIQESNVDLILATPPWERLDRFFKQLAKTLSRNEDQTLREFSLVLLGNLAAADSSIARAVALTGNAIPQLISFIEETEQNALSVANQRGINALRENPELMGTTLDMVRRSALCLRHMARIPDNRPLFMNYQQRLLALVMSQILDQGVAAVIADVIYECSLSEPPPVDLTPFFPTIDISKFNVTN